MRIDWYNTSKNVTEIIETQKPYGNMYVDHVGTSDLSCIWSYENLCLPMSIGKKKQLTFLHDDCYASGRCKVENQISHLKPQFLIKEGKEEPQYINNGRAMNQE